MKKVKIFIDAHVFDYGFQGTTSYIQGIYTEMIKNKAIDFYFAAAQPEKLKAIFGTSANVYYLKYRSTNKFYRLLIDIPLLIKKHRIDYAHFQYVTPFFKNTKFIVTLHDLLFLEFPDQFPFLYKLKNRFLFKQSAKKSDIVLTVSEYSKKNIEKYFDLNRIYIAPNAVQPVYFEKYDKEEYRNTILNKYGFKNYFLYVSRIEPRKNHHTLVDVFFENNYYNDYDLVFIGSKSINYKALEQVLSQLPEAVKKKIHFFENVSNEDLMLFLRGASLFVYPSLAEGFGIPPLEAVATLTPTACANTTAMQDFYFLNENAFNPLDKKDMNEKINIALNDRDLLYKKNELLHRYNWQLSAQIVEKLITDYSD